MSREIANKSLEAKVIARREVANIDNRTKNKKISVAVFPKWLIMIADIGSEVLIIVVKFGIAIVRVNNKNIPNKIDTATDEIMLLGVMPLGLIVSSDKSEGVSNPNIVQAPNKVQLKKAGK